MRQHLASRRFLAGMLMLAGATIAANTPLQAQQATTLPPQAVAQINALIAEKNSRTPAQQKMDSNLIYAAKMARGEAIAQGVATLSVYLPDSNADGVVVDVRTEVSQALLDELVQLGAQIMDVSARYENVRMRVSLGQIEAIAALPQVRHVMPKQEALTSGFGMLRPETALSVADRMRVLKARKSKDRADLIASVRTALQQDGPVVFTGSVDSQGDSKHSAIAARAAFGVGGAGVKVGVLSDGVTNLAASQASGDLGTVTVLPGQTGSGDEGTAMLEIIHDVAPNAQLYFATAFTSIASFAQNIRDLRAAGCDIIVDDVGYYAETPFQDGQTVPSPTNGGIVIQAVKDVAAAGALYFSSAANSGNKNDNQSGTWEGDFVDGGTPTTGPTPGHPLHDFGGQTYDVITVASGNPISLFWSDPLGGSANDYDLYRLDSTGTTILSSSTASQNGTQDPFEIMGCGAPNPCAANQRLVIVKFSGVGRFFHLDTNRARLSISTAGNTHGHAATSAPYTYGVAATDARVNGLNPFNATHRIETYSSDGPRHIFYFGNGTPITPGNVSSTGGSVLQKPDFTAADCVAVTGAGGFPSTFCGTSAAAPHAAAIAALVKSKNPALTQAQINAALVTSAIDIEGAGRDRDSGFGIVMADTAVAAAPGSTRHPGGDIDGDDKTDIAVFRPSNGVWYILKSSTNFTAAVTFQWGTTTDIPVSGDFDGDGKIDIAVFRPSNGVWYILKSSTNFTAAVTFQWGTTTDIPVSGDFDGDGKTDLAVYRPPTGVWYILKSSTNFTTGASYQWGTTADIPVVGDYDGDGKTDVSVFRPSNGVWYILKSSTNFTTAATYQWGTTTDTPVSGDYDGDGKADIAVYRPSNAVWYILKSSTNFTAAAAYQWGTSTDVPVVGDYDGDGKADVSVFRPSNGVWYILKSSTNFTAAAAYQWGTSTDIPVRSPR